MTEQDKWLEWAVRLQAIAQAGLAYGRDVYDIERFEEIRQIAAEMLVEPSGQPLEVVKELFCKEAGYRRLSLILAQPFFKTERFYWCKRKMVCGPYQEAGVMWISLSRTMLSKKLKKKQGWMWKWSG